MCMRIYMGDQKFETNTKIYVKPEEWKHEKVKGTNEETKRINKCIEGFKMKAFDLQRELMNEGKDVTLDNIKAKWFGISPAPQADGNFYAADFSTSESSFLLTTSKFQN